MKLFCIPYSGGSANIFFEWKNIFKTKLNLVPIEYKGHGSLYSEKLYTSIQQTTDDLVERYFINNQEPYIIYGHSLGSLVTYEILKKIRESGLKQPEHVIFAASRPPHLLYKRKKYTTMPKEAFMERIFELGNTPREVLDNHELRDLFFEILFADMKLIDDYINNEIESFDIPISVYAGTNDMETPAEDINEWSRYANNTFELKLFNGNHFFSFTTDGIKNVCSEIEKML